MVHVQASKVLRHLVGMTVEALVLKKKNAIREHRQKILITLSEFWLLSGCEGLSESVKKGKFVTKFFCQIMMDEVLIICEKLCLLM